VAEATWAFTAANDSESVNITIARFFSNDVIMILGFSSKLVSFNYTPLKLFGWADTAIFLKNFF